MHFFTHRRLGLASHGFVLAIGLLGGLVLLDRHGLEPGRLASTPRPPAPSAHARAVAAAWLDQALAKVTADRKESNHFLDREKLPIPELLKQIRRDSKEERAETSQRVDAIVNASSRYLDQPDPAAAMRDAQKNPTAENIDTALAIFHAWRERDPEAALASLGSNWHLLGFCDTTPALLEHEFGRDWMAQQVREDNLPYRMRRAITSGLASHLAWDAGLAGFLTCYQTIPDPELKDLFWRRFAQEWPLDDPLEVVSILTNNCPPALRDKLLHQWAPPESPFSNHSLETTNVTVEWFKQVRGGLDPSLVPEAIRNNECKPWWSNPFGIALPEPKSLEEAIHSNLTEEASKPKEIEHAMTRMVEQAIQQNPGLAEPYLTGGATRREWLDQLRQAIPGADAYPQALEQAAWRTTAGRSDPQQLMAWAAELSKQDGFNDMFREVVAPRSMSKEDRDELRKQWFEEWGRRDPVGLFAYLDQCAVWPESLRLPSDLARSRPDLLLDFAIRNGCDDAAHMLSSPYCDLPAVVRLIDALPASDVGPSLRSIRDEASRKLGETGVIPEHPSAADLQGLALRCLNAGDLDGFFSQFALVNEPQKQDELARELGRELRDILLPLIVDPKLRDKFERWPWGDSFAEPIDDPPESANPPMDPFSDSN